MDSCRDDRYTAPDRRRHQRAAARDAEAMIGRRACKDGSVPALGDPAPARPEDQVLILFGATGDLAKRKLLPGLFHLAAAGMMPQRYRIVGSGRPDGAPDAEGFRSHVREALEQFGRKELTDENWTPFAERLSFAPASAEQPDALVQAVARCRAGTRGRGAAAGLPGRAARRLRADGVDARRRWPQRTRPADRREAIRARPRPRPARSTRACTPFSMSPRSSASTTSSARRPSRTSSRFASPTACSNRSGTAGTSTMSRSTCPSS